MSWRRTALVLTLPFCLAFAGSAYAQTTYTLSNGNPYTDVAGSYTTSMSVSGFFVTAAPIGPNTTVGSGVVLSYSFDDGVQTLTELNSQLVAFSVTTDASGVPVEWAITPWATPITTMVGGSVAGIDAVYVTTHAIERGFLDSVCLDLAGGECSSAAGPSDYGDYQFFMGPGPSPTWMVAGPVPTLPEWGLILVAGLLLVFGTYALRRRGGDLAA